MLLSSSSNNYNYNCIYCDRHYKDKVYFQRHVATCQFLHKSARERNADIDSCEHHLPSTQDLLSLIQTMALRIDKLEENNKQLMTKFRQTRKKMNILEWLTSSKVQPDKCFIDWVRDEMIPQIPDILELVYQHDLITAVVRLFTDACSGNNNALPIRLFEHRTNVVYLYQVGDDDGTTLTWSAVPVATFDTYIGHICHQFIVEFNTHWYMVHQEKVATEEAFKDKYVDYYKRILGGGKYTDNVLFAKIRGQIYSKMKQNLRSAVEVDFM